MSHHRLRVLSRAAAAAIGAGALTLSLAGPGLAAPTPPSDSSRGATHARLQQLATSDAKVAGPLKKSKGKVDVYVQFSGKGTFDATQSAAMKQGKAKPTKDVAKVKQLRKTIEAQGSSAAAEAGAKVIYKTSNALPGVALSGDADRLKALAKRSDVVKITAIVPKYPSNGGTDIDTGVLSEWQNLHQTGKGVKIAVLDTGIDYTHADFGGPGTEAAYKQAQASTQIPDPSLGLYDPAKFIGGWDLVGDDYNANPNDATYQPVPHPDPNPLDCTLAGHGSHVSGTAAGYGTTADGKTFRGDYSKLTDAQVKAMRIGPGSAPEASLIGIRVFGCGGSSSVVGQALDYVLDPNGDGDFSDRAQIVNMSLGSDSSPVDDPENDIVDALSEQGILSVVASGNAGDITDVGGSPGNARSALTVANTVGSLAAADPADVTAPADLAGAYASQASVNYDWTGPESGQVVVSAEGASNTGCEKVTGDVAGKWVWLHWTDDPTGVSLPCGSGQRFNVAAAAGAAGVVLDSPTDYFTAGIAGNTAIPGTQLTKSSAEALRAAAEAGTLKLTIDPAKAGTVTSPTGMKDTLNDSSSRGVHGSNGISKPDVAAPGTSIGSVGVGSGSGAAVMSGTSMATPHTAGIAALVAASGAYTANEVKSIVMNTATADVTRDGVAYGPHRVGSGRVIADAALRTPVIAYDKAAPDLTSSVFGVIEAGNNGATKLSRTIELKNFGSTAHSYKVGYLSSTTMPGASISVDKGSVTVPANGTATVGVTLSLNPGKLGKTLDPTMDAEQSGLARAFVSDVTGRVQFTSSDEPTLRVPVTATPKPTADTAVKNVKVKKGSASLMLGGTVLDQPGYTSLGAALTLGATSGRQPASLDKIPGGRAMDLQYVGANTSDMGTDYGMLNIGVSTWGNWATLSGVAGSIPNEFDLYFDTDGDGREDFVAFTSSLDGVDLTVVELVDLKTGTIVDVEPINNVMGDVDTNSFDTNVAVFPVSLAAMGVTQENASKLQYLVTTWSQYYADENGNTIPVDETDWIGFDAAHPGASLDGAETPFVEGKNQKATVTLGDPAAKLLLLHLHNATGDLSGTKAGEDGGRAEVISFK